MDLFQPDLREVKPGFFRGEGRRKCDTFDKLLLLNWTVRQTLLLDPVRTTNENIASFSLQTRIDNGVEKSRALSRVHLD